MVGRNCNGSDIDNSFATGDVTGSEYVGGLVGRNCNGSDIDNSFATGNVTASSDNAGGLVGYQDGNITNTYALGDVSGGDGVGGLVGYGTGTNTYKNSFAVGAVSGSSNVGAFVGNDDSGNEITYMNNYWIDNGASVGVGSMTDPAGLTEETDGVKAFKIYDNSHAAYDQGGADEWDFTSTWTLAGLPRLQIEAPSDGNISNIYQLQVAGSSLANDYTITGNIDASETSTWNWSGSGDTYYGFNPIGDNTTKFTGSIDGNAKTITGLYINRSSENYVGLFGYTDTGSVVDDISLVSANVTGGNYVGAIAGYSDGQLKNSDVSGTSTVTGTNYIGGLAGYNSGSMVYDKTLGTITVTGAQYVGGLAGYSDSGIVASSATGTVSGTQDVGGAVGYNTGSVHFTSSDANLTNAAAVNAGGLIGTNTSTGTVSNSYAQGAVTADDKVGGLIGSNAGTVSYTYATGAVTANTNEGGLIGNDSSGTYSASYWDSTTSGQTTDAGSGALTGVESKTTTQLRAEATFSGWDFTDYWEIAEGVSYPTHKWQTGWDQLIFQGTVFSDRGTTALSSGLTIQLATAGTNMVNADTNASGEFYIFAESTDVADDTPMLFYISGDATYDGNTVSMSSGEMALGVDIYSNNVIVGSEDTTAITTANLDTAKGALSSDMLYSVSGSDVTLSGTASLVVDAGDTYTPGGNLTTTDLVVGAGSTYTGAGDDITMTGTFSNAGTLRLNGTESLTGFTNDTDSGTVEYYSGATTLNGGNSYNNLTISDAGDITIGSALAVNNDMTMTSDYANTLTQSAGVTVGGDFTQTAGTYNSDPTETFSVTGAFDLGSASTFTRYTGLGTSGDRYLVYDLYGLQAIQTNLDKHYGLANNIDASATTGWNSGSGFSALGNVATNFTGTLDGNDYAISGLFINRSGTDYVGLFGYTGVDSSFSDLTLTNADITGQNYVGALAGYNKGDVSNVTISGTVVGTGNVGGLAGWNYADNANTITISGCKFKRYSYRYRIFYRRATRL